MSGIDQSSQQISQIIGVIDEIAFQTNLLALNAGVEAARAGEAGRGFAVVASEVRALAQRSAEAAKEIKALIFSSAQQVSTGVRLVGETGEALVRIVAQIGEVNGVVAAIAASAQEQAVGLGQGQHGDQPDGPGDPAKRRDGRGKHRREPHPGRRHRRAGPADRSLPDRPRARGRQGAPQTQAGARASPPRSNHPRRPRQNGSPLGGRPHRSAGAMPSEPASEWTRRDETVAE